ncbi:MAG: glycoside hydrolase family 2 TIM barrel-domain containing protein [Bacteroidota bacterium]
MRNRKFSNLFILLAICLGALFLGCSPNLGTETTSSTDFNFGWEFTLIDSVSKNKNWKTVQLPHDWSVEASFDSINGEGATGYLPGGTGMYRKKFDLNLRKDEMAYLLFDGVYNNAHVSMNGKKLGFHPYGYSPFYFDITRMIKPEGGGNEIQVKVDRTRYADSRWYTGSGIYRNVDLIVKNKLHIPVWGVFVTTPKVRKESAQVHIKIKLKNNFAEAKEVVVVTDIVTPKGMKIASEAQTVNVSGDGNVREIEQNILVNAPQLWDVYTPFLYKAVTTVAENDRIVDLQETTFGIRDFRFDTDHGFFLNGRNMKIKGVCLHHDGGLVGAAVPKGVWKRKLQKLKDAGCNAIRSAHNPASEEFLDLCDEMGFLVQDEFFDEWDNPKDKRKNMNEQSVDYITRSYTEHFQEWAERDLKNTVLAHRNHPSIIQWSIGNEIEWTYPRNGDATGFFNNMHWSGNYFWSLPPNSPSQIREQLEILPQEPYDIGKTAQKLAEWTRELDTTRYIIANCILPSSSYESGYVDALDMVGFSYRRVLYDYGHKNYPDIPIMGTENLGQWHEWKAVMERPFVSGTFLWTGIDYMGESNGGWPKKGTNAGLLDLAGFEKPAFHMFKSLWNDAPHIYLATQTTDKSIYAIDGSGNPVEREPGAWEQALWSWHPVNEHWNYKDNDIIIAEVYSNCEEVELLLNGKSLGVKKLADFEDRIYKWAIPYNSGSLVAQGKKGESMVQTELNTVSEPVSIQLTADKEVLRAGGYDVAHIIAQLVDAKGNPVKTDERKVDFIINGDVKILGVDNGALDNVQDFQSTTITTYKGRCLLVVQSARKASNIDISGKSDGLKSNSIPIEIKL